jgi:uncharacterized SAM-binding protein YcdF (DUF218 family)
VLVAPWCAGPRLTGIRKPAWLHAGWSNVGARWMLWPSVFVIACLAANTVHYYQLLARGQIDAFIPVPTPLLVGIMLAFWVLATRRWIRLTGSMPVKTSARRAAQFLAMIFGVGAVAAAGVFFLLQCYQRPPREPVDLAVVLGNRVLDDGTASATLRDRTLAAVDLYRRGLARHLFLSGAVWPPAKPDGPMLNESEAMLQVCLAAGVPQSAITLDTQGVNTRATAFNAAKFMRERGLRSVVACSDDYHLFRTAQSFRAVGLDAYTVRSVRRDWPCTELPSVGRELIAIVVYQCDPSYRAPKESPMQLHSPRVVVRKSVGVLEIYDGDAAGRGGTGGAPVKAYPCITGGNPGDKEIEGDKKTPLGTFHIVFKNEKSNYHLSLGLDYPSAEDAQRGLSQGLISREEYNGILAALKSDLTLEENQKKLWYTKLGGEIFIHGHGTERAATAGCVAVSDPDIEEIFAALPVGTQVEIRP